MHLKYTAQCVQWCIHAFEGLTVRADVDNIFAKQRAVMG